jgi:RND family efflux transporter MFP subunit
MRRASVAVIGVLAVAAAGVAYIRQGADSPAVPTWTVRRTTFARRIAADGTLRAVKATPINTPQFETGTMKVAWLAGDGSAVRQGDVVVRFDRSERETALRDGESDLEAATSRLRDERVKSAAAIAGRDDDARLALGELAHQQHFQAKDESIFSRNAIIEATLDEDLARAARDLAEQAKDIERQRSHSHAAVIAVDQQKAKLAITHASKDLEATEIRAPHDGIFVLTRNWKGEAPKNGDQMFPGQHIAELPLLDAMEAELFVLEVDGSGLREGQPAEVVVEARPDVRFNGKVRLVDKLAKPRVPGVPVQYFAVVIQLDRTDRGVMKPGQRVRGTVAIDQQDALVVPREAISEIDGKSMVWRRSANGFEAAQVELGAATSGRVVVTSGLAEGDQVALRDPATAEGVARAASTKTGTP